MVKQFRWIVLVGLFVFAGGSRASAQDGNDHFNGLHLTGLINDFTTPAVGSWVIHGVWSLDMTGGPNAAQFTAELTMERSDLFFNAAPAAANTAGARNPHTHHIIVTDGSVTAIPGGFRVIGQPSETVITGNGAATPFMTMPANTMASTLQIDVTGGDVIAFSNIKLTFGGDPLGALSHFGPNALAGVVTGVK